MNWIQNLANRVFGIGAGYGKVVFLGDSITKAWPKSLIPSSIVLNYGVAGDTTTKVLGRVRKTIIAKPRKVLINVGTNDISTGNVWVVSTYHNIISKLCKDIPPQNIICCAVRPVNYLFPLTEKLYVNNVAIRNLNLAISKICKVAGCVFEPQTYSVHVAQWYPDEIMRPEHTTDGLHLSKLGYKTEYEVIKKYLVEE